LPSPVPPTYKVLPLEIGRKDCFIVSEIFTLYPRLIGVNIVIMNRIVIPIARIFLFRIITSL